jgi:hypothetical protein
MQFLMADGTLQSLDEVASAEVEGHLLVCRDRWGAVIVNFTKREVVAFGDSLPGSEPLREENRSGSRKEG